VLNKFRGDPTLLEPAPDQLQALTGIATLAVLPMWWQHGLPEEDGIYHAHGRASVQVTRTIAIVAYPQISNLDEFQPLKNIPGLRVVWARQPSELAGADWIILPGSKQTSADLAWMRGQQLDEAILSHEAQGGPVLGICGGLQMLGQVLHAPHGVDGDATGLGVLPLSTCFALQKTVQRTTAQFGMLIGAWHRLSGVTVHGFEIHHGQTTWLIQGGNASESVRMAMPNQLAWQNQRGNVLGLYVHGMFEEPEVLKALFGADTVTLDTVFDGLADFVERHFKEGVLDALI
jgi:adenosylcobyric acid synthase